MKTYYEQIAQTRRLSLGALTIAAAVLSAVVPAAAAEPGGATIAQPAAPDIDPQAQIILAKSAARYKAAKAWHVEQSVVNSGRFSKKITADFLAPNRLVVRTDEAKGIKIVTTYDGGQVSTVRDFDNVVEYQVSAPTPQAESPNSRLAFGNALGNLSGFLSGQENLFGPPPVQSVKYVGPATVEGVAVENIVVTARRRNQPVTLTYSIGKDDSLLHRVVQTTTAPDGTPSEIVETYSQQKEESQLPESAFTFTPPAGAKKVDRFTSSRGLQVAVGEVPFAINAKDLSGKALSLDQYKGKVVLLDFWATWCPPCRAELPNLKANYAKYKDQGFDVLGISLDQTTAPLRPFIEKESLSWRHIYDGYWNGPIAKAYNVRFIPSTVLIGRDGKVAAINARGEALEPAIQAALLKP